MALQPWRKAVVKSIQNETSQTKRFRLKVDELETFDFIPGQFVTLDLPIHEKPGKRWRSYSIASWPDGSNEFELLIVLLEGGTGSTYLFNEIHVGSEISFRGAQGVFTLPDPIETDLFFICTGTGIAPFRSMLHHIALHNIPHKEIYLLFGTRTQKDLLYFDEMNHLQSSIDNFLYMPTLSREQWEGCCGYVHPVYEKIINQKKTNNLLPPAKFFLCGWKDMIDEAKKRIIEMGYERKAIIQELYG